MGTISAWIKNMRLRNRLTIIYTILFTSILAISYLIIYSFSEKNREDIFVKRLSERITTAFKLVLQVKQIDDKLMNVLDLNAINNLDDKNVYLLDASGKLIYSNVDANRVDDYRSLLSSIPAGDSVTDSAVGKYQLIGLRFTYSGKSYYGIVKAYDRFGKNKIHFLVISLISTFIVGTILIVILSFFLARYITRPITQLTNDVERMSPEDLSKRVAHISSSDEIGFLSAKFNELLDKLENAFKFQYHYINHISHELKTPLAIMMANAERSLAEDQDDKLRASLQFQKNSIMELSNIITAMLDISKTEKKLSFVNSELIRIDEVVFECMEEITFLNDKVTFDFNISNAVEESDLIINGNSRMIKMTVMNLVKNAVNFSTNNRPAIEISVASNAVSIQITNDGDLINPQEQLKLFKHSFRGSNSATVKGFGMGLVLSQRIVTMHKGSLNYSVLDGNNCFVLSLPHRQAA